MKNTLDGLVTRLAQQPLPPRLGQLEIAVARSITKRVAPVPVLPWRFAATGIALALGVGVGSSAASLPDPPTFPADLTASVRLAPSSLLDTSR